MVRLLVAARDELAKLRAVIAASDLAGAVVDAHPDPAASLPTRAGYDCIIVEGERALDLVRDLRADRDVTPVVFVMPAAAPNDDEALQAAVDAGVTDFLWTTDLTPRRLAVRVRFAVASARSTRARDEILAVVSHDLRSPLHAIGLAVEAMRALEHADAAKYLGAIERATSRAERLIVDLLEASAIENGKIALDVRPIDANAVLRQAAADYELLAKESRGTIATALPQQPMLVTADRDRLLQVLGNLIGNALKHAKGSPIELSLTRVDSEARIAVRDHGPGISEVELPHVFDRYWSGRNKRGGAGLGLAIAKGIVDAHGGKIIATSAREGAKGAEFAFTLPLASH